MTAVGVGPLPAPLRAQTTTTLGKRHPGESSVSMVPFAPALRRP
jgi:hypothetical protein